MTGELDVYGVFMPALLAWSLLAVFATLTVRLVLRLVGAYRHIWHPALFDVSVFVILLGGVVTLASSWNLQ